MSFEYGSQLTNMLPYPPISYQPAQFTPIYPFPVAYQPQQLMITTMPPFAYQSHIPPQILHGYSFPSSSGDTSWVSDFNDRALERVRNSSVNNYIANGENLPVENILGFEPADRTTVENLEIKKAGEELATHDDVCSVCLEGWANGQDVKILPCGHYFHPVCADEWLLTNRFCPLCRFELPAAEQQ